MSAWTYSLSDEAVVVRNEVFSAIPHSVADFHERVNAFNALPAGERGAGTYDHSRSLNENVERKTTVRTPQGYDLTIKLAKNGEITLTPETPLA